MNNRSSGRRRGRSSRSPNRGPNDGNRQTSRNPGNAHQLCEKYKNLARDAHQQGDRVMNEYYLQFADHYFRILAEVNNRKEEQQREREESRRSRYSDDRDDEDDRDEEQEEVAAQEEAEPRRRTRKSSKKADVIADNADDETNGAERIDADRLPGAIALNGDAEADHGANGKAPRKTSTRSRTRKSDDGEGQAAEA